MKSNITFLAVFIFVMLSMIACKPNNNGEANSEFNNNIMTAAESINDVVQVNNCLLHKIREEKDSLHTYRMSIACAESLMENYRFKIDSIKGIDPSNRNTDDLLIRGVGFHVGEIRQIIKNIDSIEFAQSTKIDSMYMMLAVEESGRAGMIFAFDPKPDTTQSEFHYYNFTHPCPDMCPW